jgi:amino acid transporter
MAIGAVIYILAQLAFTAALDPSLVVSAHSWGCLSSTATGCPTLSKAVTTSLGNLDASPYFTLASIAGLGFLAQVLRADAVISPGGTGLIYLTSTSRLSFGLSKNGYVPQIFERTSGKLKIPWFGVILSAAIGMLFLVPYSSWASLVGIVTGASVMMYAGAPLALGALRKSHPDIPRSYRLPAANILAPLSFALASVVVYWSGWGVYSTLMIVIVLGYILYAVSAIFHLNPRTPKIDWGAAIWIFPWMIGMGILSYLGNFPIAPVGILNGVGVFKNVLVGAHAHIPFWYDMGIVAVFSVAIYLVAMWKALPREQVDENMREVFPPPVAGH